MNEKTTRKANIYILSIAKKVNVIFFGLLSTVIINRMLGPELKGEYSYWLSIFELLIGFLNLGISLVLPNYMRRNQSWTVSTFYMLSVLQFILYIMMSVAIWLIFDSLILLLYAMVVAFGVISLQLINCAMIVNFKVSAIANVIAVASNTAILFLLFLGEFKNVNYVFIALIVKEAIMALISSVCIIKRFSFKEVHFSEWKGILVAGIIPMLTSVLSSMNYKINILELKWLGVENVYVGLYSVGLSFAEYVLYLSDIFKDVLFNKTAENDNIDSVKLCLRVCSTVTLLAFAFLILLGKPLISIMYGAEYASSYRIMLIVVFGVYSMLFFKLLGVLFIARGNWLYYFFVLLGSVVLNFGLNFVLIPYFGMYGAALTSLVSYTFAGIMFIIKFKQIYNVKYREIFFVGRCDISLLKNKITNKFKRGKKDA